MPYCMNCGQHLSDEASFCSECGVPVGTVNSNRLCPMCGASISGFTTICPYCSCEINYTRKSHLLQKFINEIDAYDARIANEPQKPQTGWSTWKKSTKVIWIISGIFTCCISWYMYPIIFLIVPLIRRNSTHLPSDLEKQKALLIENYTIPNDKESIIEMLLYIKSKVGFLNNRNSNGETVYWEKIWMSKADQLSQKAELFFFNDVQIKKIHMEIQDECKTIRNRARVKSIIGIVILLVYLLFYPIFYLYNNA